METIYKHVFMVSNIGCQGNDKDLFIFPWDFMGLKTILFTTTILTIISLTYSPCKYEHSWNIGCQGNVIDRLYLSTFSVTVFMNSILLEDRIIF